MVSGAGCRVQRAEFALLAERSRERVLYCQPTGLHTLNHRDDFDRPVLRYGTVITHFPDSIISTTAAQLTTHMPIFPFAAKTGNGSAQRHILDRHDDQIHRQNLFRRPMCTWHTPLTRRPPLLSHKNVSIKWFEKVNSPTKSSTYRLLLLITTIS